MRTGDRRSVWRSAALAALAALLLGGCAWGITQPAEDVGLTSATVTGIVAELSDGTATYWFEYGPTKNYGAETAHQSIDLAAGGTQPVSEDLSGLDPESKYHFRLCAKEPGATQPQKACGADDTFTTDSGPSQLAITTDPGLYPEWDPDVPDYVTRCDNGPVDVSVEAPVDNEVSVDGGPDQNGSFTETVPLSSEQEFSFRTQTDVGTSNYHVRCLPNNFPNWTFDKYGPADKKWYMVSPLQYATIFDGNGVPVWWHRDANKPNDFKLLADGTLAASSGGTKYEIRDLDGNLLNTLQTVGSELDSHDMLLLPNGNYMLMTYKPRANPTDLTQYGGPADGMILDAELQEVAPDGTVVWTWNSKDHISLDETDHWWDDFAIPQAKDNQFDVFHMNAVDLDGDSIVISLRHTDAIYKIDRDSGDIVWKLGGTPTPRASRSSTTPMPPTRSAASTTSASSATARSPPTTTGSSRVGRHARSTMRSTRTQGLRRCSARSAIPTCRRQSAAARRAVRLRELGGVVGWLRHHRPSGRRVQAGRVPDIRARLPRHVFLPSGADPSRQAEPGRASSRHGFPAPALKQFSDLASEDRAPIPRAGCVREG